MITNNFSSIADAALYLANELQYEINERIKTDGKALLIMPGGNSIRQFFPAISSINVPWHKVIFALSDERCVPPDHQMSNARQLKNELLELLPAFNFYDMNDELISMINLYSPITVLSMGSDGHVASLFPDEAVEWKNIGIRLFITNKQQPNRISLSEQAILRSKYIYLLVMGKERHYLLDRINNESSALSSIYEKSNIIKC